jgi:hypothetical protein
MNTVQLFIQNQRIDLFDDEVISINLSIQNSKDPAKIFTEFTKTFTIPATPTNNKILKHYYNPDISLADVLDARKRIDALLSINYVDYKKGKVRIDGVSMENNKPKDYKITFFGNTIKLPDLFGDDRLSDISELSAYDHLYSPTNVKTGLQTNLLSGSIVYPLLTHTKRLYYDSGGSTTTDGNLFYDAGKANRGLDYADIKPALKVKNIIDKIASHYSLTFSSTFFDSSDFAELYLWLHRYKGRLMSQTGDEVKDRITDWAYESGDASNFFNGTDGNFLIDGERFIFTTFNDGWRTQAFRFNLYIDNITGSGKYNIKVYDNGVEVLAAMEVTSTQSLSRLVVSQVGESDSHDLYYEIESTGGISQYDAQVTIYKETTDNTPGIGDASPFNVFGSNTNQLLDKVVITENVPDVKVMDFMSYIFKTFNLTAYVKYTGEIYVETLDTFYNAGSTINITDFTNTNDVSIDRALPFKSIKFEYPESKTYLTKQRNEIIGGTAFGSLNYQADQDLDGGEYTIKSGFEKLLYEIMTDTTTGNNTQLGWGWMVDFKDDIESVDSIVTNPLMFFNVNGTCATSKISWTTTAHDDLDATYNRPSNINNAGTITLNFGAEIDEFNLTQNNNSLFEKYYKTYISRLFNKRTRVYKYKAKFNSSLIQRMELNATVQISDRLYLINNMSINLVTGDATLELINK